MDQIQRSHNSIVYTTETLKLNRMCHMFILTCIILAEKTFQQLSSDWSNPTFNTPDCLFTAWSSDRPPF